MQNKFDAFKYDQTQSYTKFNGNKKTPESETFHLFLRKINRDQINEIATWCIKVIILKKLQKQNEEKAIFTSETHLQLLYTRSTKSN